VLGHISGKPVPKMFAKDTKKGDRSVSDRLLVLSELNSFQYSNEFRCRQNWEERPLVRPCQGRRPGWTSLDADSSRRRKGSG
jgi:hypothetical protein